MAEKFDLKKFYNDTLPTTENLDNLYYAITTTKDMYKDKTKMMTGTNQAAAMLAHLNSTTKSVKETSRLINILGMDDYESLSVILTYFKFRKTDSGIYILNPSAVPMIQRYRKLFDEYEKQNGLISFYKQKENEKPVR